MTLQWEYSGRTVNVSVPGYIEKALLEFLHEPDKPTKARSINKIDAGIQGVLSQWSQAWTC
jgi:hypothetical protein